VSIERDHSDLGVGFGIDTNPDDDLPVSTNTKFPDAHMFRMNLDDIFERDGHTMGETLSARALESASGVPVRSRSADHAAGPSVLLSRHRSVSPSRAVVNLTDDSPSTTNFTKSPSKSSAKMRSRIAVPAAPLGLSSAGVFATPPQLLYLSVLKVVGKVVNISSDEGDTFGSDLSLRGGAVCKPVQVTLNHDSNDPDDDTFGHTSRRPSDNLGTSVGALWGDDRGANGGRGGKVGG